MAFSAASQESSVTKPWLRKKTVINHQFDSPETSTFKFSGRKEKKNKNSFKQEDIVFLTHCQILIPCNK